MLRRIGYNLCRNGVRFSSTCVQRKGLVLGAYDSCSPEEGLKLTPMGQKFDDEMCSRLSELLKGSGLKKGRALVFGNLGEEFYEVAVGGLGVPGGLRPLESLDSAKEAIRVAAGEAARLLQERGCTVVMVEDFGGEAEAAAEGSLLAVWRYQELRDKNNHLLVPKVDLLECNGEKNRDAWVRGMIKAEAQNAARRLAQAPSNIMNPSTFAQSAIELLCPCGVMVEVRERNWMESKRMGALLSMARGSCHPPLFLELAYTGADGAVKPVVLVGKGVTFDTGGLNLKACEGMEDCKGDMAGAAVVLGVMKAAAQMCLPINIKGVVPLCENLIGGICMKPGDVVLAMNGKTIRIENTDNEGRVMLADALSYASFLKPSLTMTIADLTRAMRSGLGEACSGAFCSTDDVWEGLRRAGIETGDRFWRMPLWKHFRKRVTDYVGVDVNNTGRGSGGDACLSAAFLLEFAPPADFTHIEISGTGLVSGGLDFPYLRKGMMTGRPTRTIVQFLYQMACPHEIITNQP